MFLEKYISGKRKAGLSGRGDLSAVDPQQSVQREEGRWGPDPLDRVRTGTPPPCHGPVWSLMRTALQRNLSSLLRSCKASVDSYLERLDVHTNPSQLL